MLNVIRSHLNTGLRVAILRPMLLGARGWLLIALFLGLATGLRLLHLELDPHPFMSGGPGPNEGLYAHNARNRVVEGSWKLDDWNSRILHPLSSAAQAAMFRLEGTGLLASRRLTAVIASAALLLFALLARDASGPLVALLSLAFLGFNPVFLALSRTAGPAPLGIFLMMATIGLWRLTERRTWIAPIAGACLTAASVMENAPHTLFFLGTACLSLLMVRMQAWKMPWSRRTRNRVRLFWLGAGLALVAWALFFVWPLREDIPRMVNTPLGSLRPGNVLINLFMAPFIFGRLVYWMPLVIILALVYVLVFARSLFAPIARHRPLSETRVWFFAWLLTGPLFMAMRFDRPLAALVLLAPPICFAAAEALARLLPVREVRKPDLDIMVVLGLITLVVWTAVQSLVHVTVLARADAIPEWFFDHIFRYELLIVVLVTVPVIVLVFRLWLKWRRFTLRISPAVTLAVFAVLSLAILGRDAVIAARFLDAPRELLTVGAELRSLPGGSVVAGSWAPLMALDSGHRGLVIWPGMNDESAPADLGVTHLLLQRGSSEEVLAGSPDARDAMRLRTFPVGRNFLDLYAIRR